MEISVTWAAKRLFTALEAACLIVGREPHADAVESLAVSSVYKEMETSYIEACGWFRERLEHEESPPNVADEFLNNDRPFLFSSDLLDHHDQVTAARRYSEYVQCKEFAMTWLDTNLETFHSQRFPINSILAWLRETSLVSAYKFKEHGGPTPADRRLEIKLMVDRCGGNKTAAAKQLGISRERVRQLLAPPAGKRKPLRQSSAGPFDWTGRQEGS